MNCRNVPTFMEERPHGPSQRPTSYRRAGQRRYGRNDPARARPRPHSHRRQDPRRHQSAHQEGRGRAQSQGHLRPRRGRGPVVRADRACHRRSPAQPQDAAGAAQRAVVHRAGAGLSQSRDRPGDSGRLWRGSGRRPAFVPLPGGVPLRLLADRDAARVGGLGCARKALLVAILGRWPGAPLHVPCPGAGQRDGPAHDPPLRRAQDHGPRGQRQAFANPRPAASTSSASAT